MPPVDAAQLTHRHVTMPNGEVPPVVSRTVKASRVTARSRSRSVTVKKPISKSADRVSGSPSRGVSRSTSVQHARRRQREPSISLFEVAIVWIRQIVRLVWESLLRVWTEVAARTSQLWTFIKDHAYTFAGVGALLAVLFATLLYPLWVLATGDLSMAVTHLSVGDLTVPGNEGPQVNASIVVFSPRLTDVRVPKLRGVRASVWIPGEATLLKVAIRDMTQSPIVNGSLLNVMSVVHVPQHNLLSSTVAHMMASRLPDARATYPAGASLQHALETGAVNVRFRGWILLGGWLPVPFQYTATTIDAPTPTSNEASLNWIEGATYDQTFFASLLPGGAMLFLSKLTIATEESLPQHLNFSLRSNLLLSMKNTTAPYISLVEAGTSVSLLLRLLAYDCVSRLVWI